MFTESGGGGGENLSIDYLREQSFVFSFINHGKTRFFEEKNKENKISASSFFMLFSFQLFLPV